MLLKKRWLEFIGRRGRKNLGHSVRKRRTFASRNCNFFPHHGQAPPALPYGYTRLIWGTERSNNPIIMGKLLDNRGKALRTCGFAGVSARSVRPWNLLTDSALDNFRLEERFPYNSDACGRLIANTWPEPGQIRLLT